MAKSGMVWDDLQRLKAEVEAARDAFEALRVIAENVERIYEAVLDLEGAIAEERPVMRTDSSFLGLGWTTVPEVKPTEGLG